VRRQTPPLEAAEAFILAARSVSFRAAADDLALSPSAFSRRIQVLEMFVGMPLFDRSGAAVRLTDAGQRYLAAIAPALDTIRRATLQMQECADSRVLRLVTSHSFAMGWLLSRLPNLAQRHGIDVELTIGRDAQALRSGEADLAIWGGRSEDEDDLPRDRLIDLSAVLATATRLADGRMLPTRIEDIAQHRLFATKVPDSFWQQWLERMGHQGLLPDPSVRFETTQLAYEAAASGLGLTLAVPLLSDRFIVDKRLQPLLGPAVPIGYDYGLFYATVEVARRAPVRLFARWIGEAIETSRRDFDRWSDGVPAELAVAA
jgi:LysR family transcriptional regulator, glycine cleavage system transcriptional activator